MESLLEQIESNEVEKKYRKDHQGNVQLEDQDVEELTKRSRRAGLSVSSYVKHLVLGYINKNPLKSLPPPPPEEAIRLISDVSPDAVVYTVPFSGIKIVASPHPEGGWRGLIFDPTVSGTLLSWNSHNITSPPWAKTPGVVKALLCIASRIEIGGSAYFTIPVTGWKISARWGGTSFVDGTVIDPKTKLRQRWGLEGGSPPRACAVMYSDDGGPRFNNIRNVRAMLSLVASAWRAGNGALR